MCLPVHSKRDTYKVTSPIYTTFCNQTKPLKKLTLMIFIYAYIRDDGSIKFVEEMGESAFNIQIPLELV